MPVPLSWGKLRHIQAGLVAWTEHLDAAWLAVCLSDVRTTWCQRETTVWEVLTGSKKQFCQLSCGHGRGSAITDEPRISDAHERVGMIYLRHCGPLRCMAMRPETTRLPRAKGARVESGRD